MMLLEMWAYVCDLTSFYDDVLAHESYVRTARRRESLRKLVAPLGYLPRPAVAALAELAAFADGRQVVTLPVGTAFRSGAFEGNPPQVFELDRATTIHPLLNEWTFLPVRPNTFGLYNHYQSTFLFEAGSVSVEEGDIVALRILSENYPSRVTRVEDHEGADHLTYTAVTLEDALPVPGNLSVSDVELTKPTATSAVWSRTTGGFGTTSGTSFILLDSVSPFFRTGDNIIVEGPPLLAARAITKVEVAAITLQAASTTEIRDGGTAPGVLIARVPIPAITAQTTRIETPSINFGSAQAVELIVHHTFVPAGTITVESLTEITHTNSLRVQTPLDQPRDSSLPGEFELEDINGLGSASARKFEFRKRSVFYSG